MKRGFACLILLAILSGACRPAQAGAAAAAPPQAYIQNKGSDTMVNLALAWAERYQQINPQVRLSVTGGGSGTGLVALASKTVDIANASRKIKKEEITDAQAKGVDPVERVVARDAIAVIVNPENPVTSLTIEQVSRIYRGLVSNWQEVGGENRPIVRLSRESNSGTHTYFLEVVVRQGDSKDKSLFTPLTLLLPSSEGIISEVRDNPNAIGYDGLGYVTPEVKVLAVGKKAGEGILPSVETVNNGTYPIARDLYVYTNGPPAGEIKKYLDWILSTDAQAIVQQLGFVPVAEAKP